MRAIGLKKEFIDKYFTDTVSRVGGIGIEEIAEDYTAFHTQAFDPLGLDSDMTLDSVGRHKYKSGGRNTSITRRPSICSSSPRSGEIMVCLKNIRGWWMKKERRLI